MLNAVEYFKEKNRMSDDCSIPCCNCQLSSYKNGYNTPCNTLELKHPEKALAIVENWSKEHPVKTCLDDFLEKYPNAPLEDDGTPTLCPHNLYKNAIDMSCLEDECSKCWKQPLNED